MTDRLDRGSAPVEFSLVSVLVVVVTLAVLQVAFVAHVRAIAVDSAIAGAAHAALADTSNSEGVERTRELLATGIAAGLVRDITVTDASIDGRPGVTVDVTVAMPMLGPWLPLAEITARGRAFHEAPRFTP
jgi:hypothetical protein